MTGVAAIVHSAQVLMKLHVEALFTHDAFARMRFVNEPGGTRAPRFFLGRTGEGHIWRFRADLSDSLIAQLEALCVDEPVVDDLPKMPRHAETYRRLLQADAPDHSVWAGPAYSFPVGIAPASPHVLPIRTENGEILCPGFEDWVPDVPYRQPFLAMVQAGQAVSLCCSVRITATAHEAGVETLPTFRGKGYAASVVLAWANAVQKMGYIPLYSTAWKNNASQALARKLDLIQYGVDFHIT